MYSIPNVRRLLALGRDEEGATSEAGRGRDEGMRVRLVVKLDPPCEGFGRKHSVLRVARLAREAHGVARDVYSPFDGREDRADGRTVRRHVEHGLFTRR